MDQSSGHRSPRSYHAPWAGTAIRVAALAGAFFVGAFTATWYFYLGDRTERPRLAADVLTKRSRRAPMTGASQPQGLGNFPAGEASGTAPYPGYIGPGYALQKKPPEPGGAMSGPSGQFGSLTGEQAGAETAMSGLLAEEGSGQPRFSSKEGEPFHSTLELARPWRQAQNRSPGTTGGCVVRGSPGVGFQRWTAADIEGSLQDNGRPYWNHQSGDGPGMNIGDLLSGANGNATLSPDTRPGALPFWGKRFSAGAQGAGGAADANILLTSPGAGNHELVVTVITSISAAGPAAEMGWYNVGRGVRISEPRPLVTEASPPGTRVTFRPGLVFGFYIHNRNRSPTPWYMFSALNRNDRGKQHFAVFAERNGTCWIGVEDAPFFGGSDCDYNDLVFTVSAAP